MKKILTTTLVLFFSLFILSPVFAADINPNEDSYNPIWNGQYEVTCNQSTDYSDDSSEDGNLCKMCDFYKVAINITNFLVQIAISISVLFIAVGAILMMIAGSSEKRYETGKSSMTNAVLGLVITLSAWLIVNSLVTILAPDTDFANWNNISC